ncbi:MAG TPA: MBL fold metallo-hydrolase, partial [Burkholderiaceae bacterium]|nr:MBL fold metallo-hydrolase [Burkholderiaceae bacterium]
MAVRLSLVMTLAAGIALFASAPASAQSPPAAKPEMRENCPGLVASKAPRAIPAAFQHSALKTRVNALQLALNPDQVRISYSGHSTFLVESPQLVRVATDYNDYVRPMVLPDIATMNHAHSTHYADRPDPRIPHVLRGWGPSPEQPARHDVQVRDVRVRNVPTNIRSWSGGTELHGNSIFVYEMANMCIA